MKKSLKSNLFSGLSIAVAFLVMLFVGSAIFSIVLHGMPNLLLVFQSDEIQFAIRLSFVTATVSTAVCMLLSLLTSYALTRTSMPFKKVASVLMELTLSLPYLLLGLSLLILFSSDFGKFLKVIGIKVVFSQLGIVVAQLTVNLPFCIRMVRTAFSGTDERLEYIAQLMGASKFRSFTTIVLPLCKSELVSTFILTWSRAMGEFGATLMLAGITRMKTETLPGSIYLNISVGQNDVAMSTAMIILLISGFSLILSNILGRNKSRSRIGGEKS